MLLEADDGTLPQWTISKYFIRDPIKRQAAIDDLCRLGLAEVVKTRTKGRAGSLLRLVPRDAHFHRLPRTSAHGRGGCAEARRWCAEGAQKRAEGSPGDFCALSYRAPW